jgi:hypothetical protein
LFLFGKCESCWLGGFIGGLLLSRRWILVGMSKEGLTEIEQCER